MRPSIVKHLSQISVPFQIFGLQYFSVNQLTVKSLNKSPNYAYKVQFFILIVLVPALAVEVIYNSTLFRDTTQDAPIVNKRTFFVLAIKSLTRIAFILMVFVGVLASFLNLKKHKKFFIKSCLIDQLARQNFKQSIDSNKIRIIFCARMYVFLVSFSILFGINQKHTHSYLLLINIIPYFIWFTIACKLMLFIDIAKANLKLLERAIIETLNLKLPIQAISRRFTITKSRYYDDLPSKLLIIKKMLLLVKESIDLSNQLARFEVLILFIINSTYMTSSVYNISLTLAGRIEIDLISKISNIHSSYILNI